MHFNLESFESCEIPTDEVFLITEETLDRKSTKSIRPGGRPGAS